MKKLITLLAALSIVLSLSAQAPEKMSYQAIVRNTKGELVKKQTVGMKISIEKYVFAIPPKYITVFSEKQNPVTDENGLISIAIGTGTLVSGSILFKDIDWAGETLFIKTEIDPAGGSNYTITARNQLLSVPYALHSKNSKTAISSEVADTAKNVVWTGSDVSLKIYYHSFNSGYTVPLRISNTDLGISVTDMGKINIICLEVGWAPLEYSHATQYRSIKDGIYYEICTDNSGFAGIKIYFPDKQEYHDRAGRIIFVI